MKTNSKKTPSGHAEHIKASEDKGLSGKIERPLKITFLGAGSMFTPRLVNDIAQISGDQGGTLVLVDIDESRLNQMGRLVRKIVRISGKRKWKVITSPLRRKVLKDSNYLINCIEVSGMECVRFDNDIPLKYGIDQCIGDTVGPGGLFKGLRSIPVWLNILSDCEQLCPDAVVLNYTNPMGMMCLAAGRVSSMKVVGLCHSVQGTSRLLAKRANIPYNELRWECAGINHLAWFVKLQHQEKNLYPLLIKAAKSDLRRALKEGWPDPQKVERPDYQRDLVRKDMMVHFGAFITESSGHLSEYLPYYRKRQDPAKKYLRPGYDGESSFYANNWPRWRENQNSERSAMLKGTKPITWERSWEYASWIIEAREKDCPFRIHGNVMNRGRNGATLIGNLPADGCVEVSCMVDQNGINPTRYGELPPHMASLCASNMHMIGLGAQAAIERSKELAIQSLLVDPLTSAVCSPAEIRKMTLEMFRAEKDFLPGYR